MPKDLDCPRFVSNQQRLVVLGQFFIKPVGNKKISPTRTHLDIGFYRTMKIGTTGHKQSMLAGQLNIAGRFFGGGYRIIDLDSSQAG